MHTAREAIVEETGSTVRDLVVLIRPRLAFLGILTVVLSYLIARPPEVDVVAFGHLLVGSLLALAGASALNQVLERDPDSLMRRTSARPIPAGRMAPSVGALFGVGLALFGLLEIALGASGLAALWAGVGLAAYLLVYTPLKPRTSLSTVVGAVPGAVPVLMGWAAATGRLDAAAWTLFGIVFLWQLPHFLAIAWMYRADYGRAGFRMLPVEDPVGDATSRQAVLYAVALLPVSLLPTAVGLAGPLYMAGALTLGLAYIAAGVSMSRHRTGLAARRLLRVSVMYLPLLLLLLAVDRLFIQS
jgi:protoheme IX farnesyltransferase